MQPIALAVGLFGCADVMIDDTGLNGDSTDVAATGGGATNTVTGGATGTGGASGSGTPMTTGGTTLTGGSTSTGGAAPTGGSMSTGGTASSGGATSSGGTTSSGGSSSSGGSTSSGGSSSGGSVGTGSCAGIPTCDTFNKDTDTSCVTACDGGTPCTQGGGVNGTTYEFRCDDIHNCHREDPATTNWAISSWTLVSECTD